jgi:hypothetical protein
MTNLRWHKLALNSQSLEALYDNVPELENVDLFSINLNREVSNIEIRFNLPRFPEHPSKRWHKKFNTAQLSLKFWTITNFEARGWQPNMRVEIDIGKKEELIKVVLFNSKIDLLFSFSCEMFRIESITAYQHLEIVASNIELNAIRK